MKVAGNDNKSLGWKELEQEVNPGQGLESEVKGGESSGQRDHIYPINSEETFQVYNVFRVN